MENLEKIRAEEIIQNFKNKKIIVLGDFYIDEYIYTESERLSPEATVPRAILKSTERVPGAAGNVANVFRTLGANVYALGVIGSDSNGRMLKELLMERGINANFLVEDKKRITGKFSRIMLKSHGNFYQHVIRIDEENTSPINKEIIIDVSRKLADLIKTADAIFVADYDETEGFGITTKHILNEVVRLAKENKVLTVGISRSRIKRMKGFDILIGNQLEIEAATESTISNESELAKRVEQLKKKLNNSIFVATLSEKGIACFGKETIKLPSFASEIVDVCGAGDALSCSFVLSMLSGASLKESCIIGNTAAAVAVSKPGTASVAPREIISILHEEEKGMRNLKDLMEELKIARSLGKKIVFANGYFDFFHGGHVSFLRSAKKLGDILVVAINSDESTKLNKGAMYPLISEKDRARIISSFSFVDFAVIFNEMTPLKIIKEIRPDILVKGGNFQESNVIGGDLVKSYGGKVIIIPLDGPTTTEIINHIKTAKN